MFLRGEGSGPEVRSHSMSLLETELVISRPSRVNHVGVSPEQEGESCGEGGWEQAVLPSGSLRQPWWAV